MKFLKTYGVCLAVSEAFLFLGGYMLFDFQRHPFRAFAAAAFVPTVLITAWLAQEERIEALEKRVRALEAPEFLEDSEDSKDSENSDSDHKENDR